MLDPDFLLHVSEGAEEISEQLHTEIINRIVERILARIGRGENYLLTATDKWNIEVLQDAGYLLEDIQREIAKATRKQEREIKAAMEDAGVRSISYDDEIYKAAGLSPAPLMQSPHLIRLMERDYKKTMGEWRNFTGTFAEQSQTEFIKACDRAYRMTTSGMISYSQAVTEALDEVIKNGVVITYPSGHKDTIETATLRAVRTGISQACGAITDARMDEMGWDIVLVSAHLGARVTDKEDYTNHYWWQGKFYSKSGKDTRFPPFSVCGMGNVQGIHGANCRHTHGPGDGVFNPYREYDSEENKKAYDLSQRQRAMERGIRKTKRQCINWKASMDNPDNPPDAKANAEEMHRRKSVLLSQQNEAYNKFCEENNLKRRADRIQIAKWDREQARAAMKAAVKKIDGE